MTRFLKMLKMRPPAEAASFTKHFRVRRCRNTITPENGGGTSKRPSTRRDSMTLRNVTRNLAVGIAAGIVLIATQSVRAADDRGSVQGVVNNASGQPVTGAMVKLKNADRRLTFMVVSQ